MLPRAGWTVPAAVARLARDGMENPRLPRFLRGATMVECAVVAWAAILLFALPSLARQQWAWITPLFNSRFIGAVYFGAFVPLLIAAVIGRWTPGRLVLWMIFTFTTEIMIVMFFYTGRFLWGRADTYGFWVLYLFFPFNSAAFLYAFRSVAEPAGAARPRAARALLALCAFLLAGYAIALIAAPTTVASFWPWPVDDFHGRIYAASFLTPAVGLWMIRSRTTLSADATVGATLVTFGLATIAGLLISDSSVPAAKRVDFAAAGTWGFIAISVAMALLGAVLAAPPLCQRLRGNRERVPVATQASQVIPNRE
jgi:hypothetical protein